MKQVLISIVVFVVFTIVCTYLVPYYMMLPLAIVYAALVRYSAVSLLTIGSLVPTIIWCVLTYMIDSNSGHRGAAITAEVFGGIPPWSIYVITGLLIGLLGLAGTAIGILFRSPTLKTAEA